MNIEKIRGIVAMIFIGMFGAWDINIQCLLFCMMLDLFSGMLDALLGISSKTEKGGMSSKACFRGIVKKVMMLVLVSLGVVMEKITGIAAIRTAVVNALIIEESLSILENISKAGVPVPNFVKKILEVEKNEIDTKTYNK